MSVQHFRKIADFGADEIEKVLSAATNLKVAPAGNGLAGKSVALLFSKPSTRTRVSFEVGIAQLEGHALFLGESETQMRVSETIEDTARVLSRYVDALVIRTFAQKDVEDLAQTASVPVVNALTDLRHPCQALTDIFTVREAFAGEKGRQITYLGDGNNVAVSLAAAGALTGTPVCLCMPPGLEVPPEMWGEIQALSAVTGTPVWVESNPEEAVRQASALYTDVWVSMGQPEDAEKVSLLEPYRVDTELLQKAPWDAVVMHCLPAHRGMEITDEVLDGNRSIVFEQAENRLHVQKALLLHLVGREDPC